MLCAASLHVWASWWCACGYVRSSSDPYVQILKLTGAPNDPDAWQMGEWQCSVCVCVCVCVPVRQSLSGAVLCCGECISVFQTETVMDTLNPMFKEFNLPVRRMLYYSRLV